MSYMYAPGMQQGYSNVPIAPYQHQGQAYPQMHAHPHPYGGVQYFPPQGQKIMPMTMSTMPTTPGNYGNVCYVPEPQPQMQQSNFCQMNQNPQQGGLQNSCPYMNYQQQNKNDDLEEGGDHHSHMNCFVDKKGENLSVDSDISGEGEKEIVRYECLSGCCNGDKSGGNGFTHGQSKFECDHHESFSCGGHAGPIACNGGCCPMSTPQMNSTTTHITSTPGCCGGVQTCYSPQPQQMIMQYNTCGQIIPQPMQQHCVATSQFSPLESSYSMNVNTNYTPCVGQQQQHYQVTTPPMEMCMGTSTCQTQCCTPCCQPTISYSNGPDMTIIQSHIDPVYHQTTIPVMNHSHCHKNHCHKQSNCKHHHHKITRRIKRRKKPKRPPSPSPSPKQTVRKIKKTKTVHEENIDIST